jgi:uncharacterized phage-associated protein
MSVSPIVIANKFIELASANGTAMSNMKLQKLVYIAHGFFLGYTDRPLSSEPPQAWQYGPVFPSLYRELRDYGAGLINRPIEAAPSLESDTEEAELIAAVWNSYGKLSAASLVSRTHAAGTPWSEAWTPTCYKVNISESSIKSHFKELIAKFSGE